LYILLKRDYVFFRTARRPRIAVRQQNPRKGGAWMKKLVSLLMMGVLALSLAACAATGGKDKVRVKCPACGYEFDAPSQP
jgi:hypothetical protein